MGNPPVFRKTYEMAQNPPAAMSWDEYSRRLGEEWRGLLNAEAGCDERNIQHFLEKHPSMVPMVSKSPFPYALISQPPLAAIGRRVPDFLWLGRDSLHVNATFIEIESPCKQWFTQAGVPHHDLTQAVNQLAEWREWLNQPVNRLAFLEQFEITEKMKGLRFRAYFMLIYGRRSELMERPDVNRLRGQFQREDQEVMTFDRLEPSHERNIYITAVKTVKGYRALHVPPVFQWSPMLMPDIMTIQGIPDAVRQSEWMSEDRKAFLVDRYAYWENWSRGDRGKLFNSGDWE